MSDSSFLIAESFVARPNERPQPAQQTEMQKELDDAQRGLVEMLERSIAEQKAALPFGQGEHLDVTV
ncbi:hypothetical protein [Bosea sp. (in: a-proteobacteria)]|jgi:hypothetical protein|uniref:hypothetical protein n=1 Tax=Bosea sp. (in: a-proteobacteria) TaxID=1871050 RepID=UPI00086AF8AD|nr:hypothetical protein [Bosea sp. (in: a-proteobacteria)]MBN9437886.1 hypothetical protein [Bosea sp. (in: a-proteobacteria)]MBN9447699.1 hypothetical protein [Bosea sp. (in: a-proteobacteria)]ODT43713.1 MAG: hypothetical protein ABS59_22695 [Methylobacterium sp. SCN 67-24]